MHVIKNHCFSFTVKGKHSLALSLTGGLVEGVAENGVLLLQTGQLGIWAFFQLVLQADDLLN